MNDLIEKCPCGFILLVNLVTSITSMSIYKTKFFKEKKLYVLQNYTIILLKLKIFKNSAVLWDEPFFYYANERLRIDK